MTTRSIPIGAGVDLDVDRLISTRLLVQANSGGGKSWLLRRLLELGVSAILDIYELNPHERIRFVRLFLEAPPRRPGRLKLRKDEAPAPSSREPGWWVKHAAPTDSAREGFIAESRHQFETRISRTHVPAKLFPNQMGGFS